MNEYASNQFQRYLRSYGTNPEFLRRAASALDLLTQDEEQADGGDLSPKRIADLLDLVQEKLEGAQKCSP